MTLSNHTTKKATSPEIAKLFARKILKIEAIRFCSHSQSSIDFLFKA